MCTSKDASKVSKGVVIVMFLIIVLLMCFTEVRVYYHEYNSLFITWNDAQVFIYDKLKFHQSRVPDVPHRLVRCFPSNEFRNKLFLILHLRDLYEINLGAEKRQNNLGKVLRGYSCRG